MSCIKKIQINDIVYEANVDFRIAIRCNEIAKDVNIGDYERSLAIIYTMFGEKGLDHPKHYDKLLTWILKYLSCDKEVVESDEKPDMDYVQDMDYIEASFMSDFNIDLEKEEMDWHKFNKLMNGLSNSEFGNCCVLNRIRNLRRFDTSQIKDFKEREKMEKAKRMVALKKQEKETKLNEQQQKSVDEFYKSLGF